MVEAAARFSGRIDVLCNNAAYLGEFHAVLEAADDEWERCLSVQVLGTNNCTRAVLPYMLQQRAGSIVNIVSIQAMVGCPTSVAYTAAKSALLGFTLSAAYDYGAAQYPRQLSLARSDPDPHFPQAGRRSTINGNATKPSLAAPAIPGRWPPLRFSWPPMKRRISPAPTCPWTADGRPARCLPISWKQRPATDRQRLPPSI